MQPESSYINGLAKTEGLEKPGKIKGLAYPCNNAAVRFYEFTRTMDTYKAVIATNTTLVLSTDSELFKFLKSMAP